jgi:type I restriction enzyme S subunit
VTEARRTSTSQLIRDGLLEIGDGYRAKNSELGSVGLPFARAQNVNNGFDFRTADHYPEDKLDLVGSKVSVVGDCVFTSKGSVGRIGFVDATTTRFVYSPQLSYWRSLNHADLFPGYLRYWLQGTEFGVQRDAVKSSTDMADYVNLRDQRRMVISLPQPGTQRKIAAILSAYDDLIENNNRRIKVLEEMAHRIYREWFVDFRYPGHEVVPLVNSELGPIPKTWEALRLDQVCDLMQAGGTPPRSTPSYWKGGAVNWFTTGELQDGFLLESAELVTELAIQERKTRAFPTGTVLMAIYGSPTVGRLGVLTMAGACNQAALAMHADPQFMPQVVLYYALLELRGHFNLIAQGAAQQNISKEKVAETVVVCPPQDLTAQLARVIEPMWYQRSNLAATNAALRATSHVLLPRLVSGDIDVQGLDIDIPEVAA